MGNGHASQTAGHGADATFHRIARNSGFNVLRGITQLPVAIIVPPLVLGHLGLQEYGVWALLKTFASYAVVIDLGMTRTVTRYTADAVALTDYARANRLLRCYFLMFAAPSFLLLGLIWGLSVPFARIFAGGDEALVVRAAQLLVVTAVTVVLAIFVGLFRAFLNGLERMDIAGVLSGVTAGLTILTSIAVLSSGRSLDTLIAADLAVGMISLVLFAVAAKSAAPWLRVRPHRDDLREIRRVARFNILTGIQVIVGIGHYQVDKIIIGAFLGMRALAYYDIAYRLVALLATPFGAIVEAVVPSVAGSVARGEERTLQSVFSNVHRFASLCAAPLYTFVAAFAPELLAAWTAGKGSTPETILAVRLLCVVFALGSTTSAADAVLTGWGRLKPSVVSACLTLGVGSILSLCLVSRFHLAGVLAAAVIGRLIGVSVFWALFARASWGHGTLSLVALAIGPPFLVAAGIATVLASSLWRLVPSTVGGGFPQLIVAFVTLMTGFAIWVRLTGRHASCQALLGGYMPRWLQQE